LEPPNYRREERTPDMIAARACTNCVHERYFELRPVCLRYLCYVRLYRVCDDWDGGKKPLMEVDGKTVLTFLHDHDPDPDEAGCLRGGRLEDLF
jgi:hypothetical protein